MPSPIETNAVQILKALFDLNPADGVYPEGKDLKEATGLNSRDINDAIEYLDSQHLIERLNYSGTSPYQFGGAILNVHGKQRYYEQNKKKMTKKPSANKSKVIKIFISHSNKDAGVAEKVINLLRSALNLTEDDIRCTSVNGYRLKGGTDTNISLKGEIFSCELLIGLISANSMQSHYTLFELGARWGANKPMLPLIIDAKGTEILGGPLKGINALDAHDVGQVLQFVSDAGGYLNKPAGNASAYHTHIQSLIDSLKSGHTSSEPEVKARIEQEANNNSHSVKEYYYLNADEIIKESCEKEWPNDFAMQSYCIDKHHRALDTLRKGRPADIPENQFDIIRVNAAREYPNDFAMRVYEEEKQFNALRKLRGR